MKITYYHISPIENQSTIEKEGLKCDEDGYIYVMTETDVREGIYGQWGYLPDIVAMEQVLIKDYLLIAIDSDDITGEIEDDNVAEYFSTFQKRIRQDVILPEDLDIIEHRSVDEMNYHRFKFCILKGRDEDGDQLGREGRLPLPFTPELQRELEAMINVIYNR